MSKTVSPRRPFSQAVDRLANASLRDANVRFQWRYEDHPYAFRGEFRGFGGVDLVRSQFGDWGVVTERPRSAAIAELLISRVAAAASLPVAPVFIKGETADAYKLISVIPFERLVRGSSLPLLTMQEFQHHYSFMMPFMMVMGPHMDRHNDNVCMSADGTNRFVDYDFDDSSLSDILRRGFSSEHAPLYEPSITRRESVPDIHWPSFLRGCDRVKIIGRDLIERTLKIIEKSIALSDDERADVITHITARCDMLERKLADNSIARSILPAIPVTPDKYLQAEEKRNYACLTYSFA